MEGPRLVVEAPTIIANVISYRICGLHNAVAMHEATSTQSAKNPYINLAK